MALLQISEPGQTPEPHRRKLAVGIDLGTTHSLVAAVRHGVPECLPDAQGRVLLPSVVHYLAGGGRRIGWEAANAPAADAHNTVSSVKRLMGRRLRDVVHADKLALRLLDKPGMVAIQTVQGEKSPVEISAEILALLRQRAEDTLGGALHGAVITVPAYFDDAQRQATKDAAQWAGLNVLRLINEPTAAAIAYGLDNASEGIYAVFDLGGGTFDVSILRLAQGVFEVIATGGDSALGGDDYDQALADWMLAQRRVPSLSQTPAAAAALTTVKRAARAAKEALTSAESVAASAFWHAEGADFEIRRGDFEQLTRHLTARCLDTTGQVLRDAQLQPQHIHGVVMGGGATRMPQIRRAVADWFARAPLVNLNPDEVVALGAAIQANQLVGNDPDSNLLLLDVIPLSLGIETMGGLVERIVPRNQTIPAAMAQDFTTCKDGQTALALHVVQGERDLARDCRSLARFELRGIPPMAAGAARIRVTFTVDADGLLHVSAREQTSGAQAQIEVRPSCGLSDQDIARMLRESFSSAAADMQSRALAEARVQAQRILLATQSALDADGALLAPAERERIDTLAQALQELLAAASASAQALEQAAAALAAGTEAFAATRMNASIHKALTGKNISAL
ncbi:MAG: Fe-S protein assembly chaperone HscA [Burkholderiaceae bacterium]|jgi:molecular chaperone HscA|nr:Fe-S protein assembly chaperone HscA [Burkholderiaceae bacterium]